MKIAIIGSGNVGTALATRFSEAGHEIYLGVRDISQFKGKDLLKLPNTSALKIPEAVGKAKVIILATPAPSAVDVARSLGDTTGKVIIDTMNIVMGKGPSGFGNTTEAILANTQTKDVVKCFNTTGANNLLQPNLGEYKLDLFVAGDSKTGKDIAIQLSLDLGAENCYDVGGNSMFAAMEQFAFFWINLAMMQGLGREFMFKLVKR